MNHNIDIEAGKESTVKLGAPRTAFALAMACLGVLPAHAAPDPAEVLALLHDGRFEAARRTLLRDDGKRAPAELFLNAFTTYWLLVFDDENDALRTTLDAQLAATISAAEAVRDPALVGDAALWSGSSHLLVAELRASQRRPLAAAFEAKKAKRSLESASIAGPDATDARFGLGTYNYVADTVPSYVKGLRALLFLPKGNRNLGLRQLEEAATGSRYFALEARTLLITIYANKHERQYGRAIDERDHLLAAFPDTVASAYASARLDISLGRNDAALAQLARAEARARALGDVDPVVLRCIDLLKAKAELSGFRPDLAAATTAAALASGSGLSPAIRADLDGLHTAAKQLAEGITWPQGTADFGALAAERPDRPLLALLAGDAGLKSGRAQEALDWFARATAAGLQPAWQAGCVFRQGQAEDLLGRRPRALELYKQASVAPGFVARDGAFYYQQSPYGVAR